MVSPGNAVKQYPLGVADQVTRILDGGAGPSVVCLHGVGARADRWQRNLPCLADAGYRAIAIDLPGHGLASKDDDSWTVPRYAQFVLSLLDALGVGRTALIGTSLGGHIAATVACLAPDRVDALVLVGTLGIVPLGPDACNAVADSITDRSRDGIGRKLRTVVHDSAMVTDSWVEEEYRVNNSPGAEQAFAGLSSYFRVQIDQDVVGPALAALDPQPATLLVWGAEDVMVRPELGQRSLDVIPAARLVTIPATGHAPYFEDPGTFNEAVVSFLATQGQSRKEVSL